MLAAPPSYSAQVSGGVRHDHSTPDSIGLS